MHFSSRTWIVSVAPSRSIAPTGHASRQGAVSQWTHRTGTFNPGAHDTRTREREGGDSKRAAKRVPAREWETAHWTSHVLHAVHLRGSRATFFTVISSFRMGISGARRHDSGWLPQV